jgi:hypothetical protein
MWQFQAAQEHAFAIAFHQGWQAGHAAGMKMQTLNCYLPMNLSPFWPLLARPWWTSIISGLGQPSTSSGSLWLIGKFKQQAYPRACVSGTVQLYNCYVLC